MSTFEQIFFFLLGGSQTVFVLKNIKIICIIEILFLDISLFDYNPEFLMKKLPPVLPTLN